ncbi:helix-turn-helix transcriptional regulator [Paenibacillus kribbensis]|uniref:helix-turn-helix domain-containing protein n=1 Tax=Paenibacillus kribbensis TaxID=172713 RepID=UPI002DBB120D|nr:helix-turn-helix transcriptional regulator [Paenibacillus kribbensis]MEC0234034.1 helix-turn-helix transcriptional regulator [Paenibacillus kribbensis]
MAVIYFKENLKRFREDRGWSKEELGERVGVSGTMIGYWEKGTNEPRMGKVQMIANVLGVDTDELLFQSPPRSTAENINTFFEDLSDNKRKLIEEVMQMDEDTVELYLKLISRK